MDTGRINPAINKPLTGQITNKIGKCEPETPKDSVSISSERDEPGAAGKVFGTVATAVGAVAGRAAILPGLASVGAGMLLGSLLGPVGTVAGAIGGLYTGAKAEKKTKIGRVIGGLVGGAVGTAIGKIAGKLGYKPAETMAKEAKGFSFKSLFKKLQDPHYTSHKKISSEEAKKILGKIKPGDLIVTNNDEDFRFEMIQKAMGKSADWTHIAFASKDKTSLEVLISTDGAVERDMETLLTENHHVMILRPNYKDRKSIQNAEKAARDYFGVKYDHKFSLKSDDEHYCQEYVYKLLQKGSPEIKIKPGSVFKFKHVTADEFVNSEDMTEVHSTGSNFWLNYLSKFS